MMYKNKNERIRSEEYESKAKRKIICLSQVHWRRAMT
jgi:hypothetical protein